MNEPSAAHLRLKMGELTTAELRIARAAYRLGWAEAAECVRQIAGEPIPFELTDKGRELLDGK
jgi:hypothetical protein